MSEFSKFRNIDSFQCNVCYHFDRFNCCCSEEPYCVMEVERVYQQGRKDQRKEDEELNYHYQTSHECYMQGRADVIEEFADNMQLVKLVECEDVPRELIEAIEKQIGICALRVKEKMLKEQTE